MEKPHMLFQRAEPCYSAHIRIAKKGKTVIIGGREGKKTVYFL